MPAPGEVLNSLDTLRRVVQEISLEEIKDAEQKASLMISRLTSLQAVCADFFAIRQFVTKVEQARLHRAEEDSSKRDKKIPEQDCPTSDRPSENVTLHSGNALPTGAEIDRFFENGATGESLPPTDNQPPAPNPTTEADANPTSESKENLTVTQFNDFTLGEKQLGEEKRFELGVSVTQGGPEDRMAGLDKGSYAPIAPTQETSPAPFSLHGDQGTTELKTTPHVDTDTVSPGFLDQMISNFTAFVGPMAAVIVDEQIATLGETFTAFPRSRLDELITLVSREILDDRSKALFQKQIAGKVRTLTSKAAAAAPRKKDD